MIKSLIKPLLRFKLLERLIVFSYLGFNRLRHYKKINQLIKINSGNDITNFRYDGHDTFFGYYDKLPVNSSHTNVVFHASPIRTFFKPSPKNKIKIIVQNLKDSKQNVIAETSAYNWQQGARLQWISDHEILFNDFCQEKKRYVSHSYNVITGNRIKTFDYPVQDAYFKEKFYSINYNRLRSLRPDYGYFNSIPLTLKELKNTDDDGIWEIDYNTRKGKLIVSLKEVVSIEKDDRFNEGLHWINHVMVSPNGEKLIFLHRCKVNKIKRDRLFSFDLVTKKLKLVVNYAIISHFNWINNDSIICFEGTKQENLAYKKINLRSNEIINQDYFKRFNFKDGHPSVYKKIFITDTYPNTIGIQKLIFVQNEKLKVLHEVYHPLLYFRETRCDLHPRIHNDKVFFDHIDKGHRQLAMIKY